MLKRTFLIGAVFVALLVSVLGTGIALSVTDIRVGGPRYSEIVQDKDLVADILPPPVFVVEAYLTAYQLANEPQNAAALTAKLSELHRQFDEREAVWSASNLRPSLKDKVTGEVVDTADSFWRIAESDIAPAAARGDVGAAQAALARATQAFQAHRAAVDRLVEEATATQGVSESEAMSWSNVVMLGAAFGIVLILAAIGAGAFYLMRKVFAPLTNITTAMERLAGGDTEIQVVGADRKDEIGALARALTRFKEDALALDAASVEATAKRAEIADISAVMAAAKRAQAVIEFDLTGTIQDANENFLKVVGYSLDEIKGRHHSMFVDKAYAASPEYADFWRRLGAGEFMVDKFNRYGRGGARAVIEASYNPIFGADGKPYKVVKFATDVTAAEIERERRAELDQKLAEEQREIVSETGRGLTALASGDLTYRIDMDFPGEYAALRQDFNEAMGKLEEAMGVITSNAAAMQTGSGEISQAADDLSRRTEQQAATLEETAAALDEITATVRRTAEGAERANTVVTEARGSAETSGIVVSRAVSAMGEIERSAEQISQIIGVIDEIAFQTNLLALNAGVEAARAGDAGRGFAVVASEVRALAQRSAEAAKEIKALISASTGQVKEGVNLVGQTGEALTAIVTRVSEINSLMAEINASAQEQATALSQVNTAVNQMDQTTQQNAAMVEQSTAASHSLRQEASELARLVSRFQVSGHASSGVGHAPAAAVASPSAARAARAAAAPVHAAQSKIAQFAKTYAKPARANGGGAAAVQISDDWEEF